jgi:hypothetical protein
MENQAQRKGITVREIKRKTGIGNPVHRVNINLEIQIFTMKDKLWKLILKKILIMFLCVAG